MPEKHEARDYMNLKGDEVITASTDLRLVRGTKLITKLQESGSRISDLSHLSSGELARRLMDEVWANTELFTPTSDLLEVVIERLKGYRMRPFTKAKKDRISRMS